MVKITRKNVYNKYNFSRKFKRIIFLPKPIDDPNTFKKRAAIIITGRIKGYTYIQEKLLKIQKTYNAKIFCSINKKNRSEYINNFCNVFNIKEEQINLEITPNPPEYLSKIRQSSPTTITNMYSCLFHKKRCFELLERFQNKYSKQFDYIIYYRADIDNMDDFILEPLEQNTVYIPAYPNQNTRNLDVDGINDQIAYGNYDSMKIYLISVIFLEGICKEHNVLFHPELYLKKYLMDINKINVKTFNFNYKLHEGRYENIESYDNFE